MATIREYFDYDVRIMTAHADWQLKTTDGKPMGTLIAKVALDFEANAKYWYFYVPVIDDLSGCLGALLTSPDFASCRLRSDGDFFVAVGHSDYSEKLTTNTLQFTKRVHLYLDFDLTPSHRSSLVEDFLKRGYFLSIRDREYARKKSESEKPQAFISHDSRDKDSFVRELAQELTNNFCTVWYDEYSLKVGDSLRASIERGLKETKKCIVVLSPHFLSNTGWGQAEFDSVFTREMLERKNIILPVWLNVDRAAVYKYSPRLADKVGLPSNLGAKEIARRIARVVKTDA